MNKPNKKVETLRPLTRIIMTIGELPTSYLMSMTYLEQVTWLCNYLQKTIIPLINNNAEVVQELQDYINNLDIQEYVDTKLDEMAESGQLTDIIAQYLDLAGILAYNTIADLEDATNVTAGSICYCIGQNTYDDGKGAFYKVRQVTIEDVIDGFNIVSVAASNTIIAERLTNYYIDNLQSQITTLSNKITDLETEKILIIGDSFIDQYVDNWGTKLKALMGLSNDNCVILGEGGAGIYNVGNQDTNFLGLLQANISSITNKDKFTKIIIGGGFNDSNATAQSTILTAMQELLTYCKQQFPNAKIYLSCFGWTMKYDNVTARQRMCETVIPAYKQAYKYGGFYLSNTEYCYRDLSLYEESTSLVHPNDDGQKEIAQAIYEALNTGYTPRVKISNIAFDASTTSDITSANCYFTHYVTQFENIVNLDGSFELSKSYNPSNTLTLDLGLMPDPYLRKCSSTFSKMETCQGRMYTTSNAVHFIDVQINYDTSGHVIAYIPRGLTTSTVTINNLVLSDVLYFSKYFW